jgi:hypothetical protein
MKKLLTLSALLLCGTLSVFSQSVVCDSMLCSLEPISKISSLAEAQYELQVKMYLSATDLRRDTLVLYTTSAIPYPISAFYPRDLQAFVWMRNPYPNDKHEYEYDWDSTFSFLSSDDPFTTNIKLPKERPDTLRLSLEYKIIGSALWRYFPEQNCASVFNFSGEQEYFYPKDMPIRSVRVFAPDDMLAFQNLYDNYKGESMLNLTFIKKNAFRQQPVCQEGNITVSAFVPDSVATDSTIQAHLVGLSECLKKVTPFVKQPRDIQMLLLIWRSELGTMGKGFGNLFVCDLIFPAKDLLHETLHLLFENKINHTVGGGYFVGESIIEWLARYYSGGLNTIDTKVIAENQDGSLYDIKMNHSKTYHLVYTVGTAIVQQVAKQVGEEKMANALMMFLQGNNAGEYVSYDDFIRVISKQLPKRAITRLDRLVRGLEK